MVHVEKIIYLTDGGVFEESAAALRGHCDSKAVHRRNILQDLTSRYPLHIPQLLVHNFSKPAGIRQAGQFIPEILI